MMQPASSYEDSTRANDVDRADVCAILDKAYADGELDADEHRQRCSSAMSAKKRSQLLDMISDLQARPPVFRSSRRFRPTSAQIESGSSGLPSAPASLPSLFWASSSPRGTALRAPRRPLWLRHPPRRLRPRPRLTVRKPPGLSFP
ncbi:MAG: hypothetical protein JWP83_6168 [Mycobacterium sp.]|jgi:hypothetical protein|uniref:DUF1707 SHOCT-like domain-containing protein n=1 Tax=Mycobacterium sp. TaxID=1785 RepID=UPI00345BAC5D|nr:hypothetical protein [Mycobacterium sp.]